MLADANVLQSPVRVSSQTIASKRLPMGGYALINSITGAIDLVSDDVGAAIWAALADGRYTPGWRITPDASAQIVSMLDSDVRSELLERGHLTTLTFEAERELVRKIADATHHVQKPKPRFMILPSLDCNYRCTYCFERPVQSALNRSDSPISYTHGNVLMTVAHVERVYEAIASIQREVSAVPSGEIILYGGEPLDQRNATVVRALVERGKAAGFTFTAVTNGHDLDHFLPVLGKGAIASVQVSVDGPRPVHDVRRIHMGKESSFDKVISNVRLLLEQTDVEIHLRVHVDPSNIGLFEEVLREFEQWGWTSNERFIIYANTVYEKGADGNVAARISTGELADRLRGLCRKYSNVFSSGPAVHIARSLSNVLASDTRYQSRGTYCSANFGNYMFAPDGAIYSCWESVGKASSKIGEYMAPGGVRFDEAARNRWFSRSVALLPECQECAYALFCGGGCAQYSEYTTGTLLKPYCDDFQRTFSSIVAEELDLFLERQFSSQRDLQNA